VFFVAADPECMETKTAPADDGGLTATGALWLHEDSSQLPDVCGPSYWIGDPFEVPDFCCSEAVGAFEWVPFEQVFTDGSKCENAYPFGPEVAIAPKLVSGCSADGTQFYGEKCGGSIFDDITDNGNNNEAAYGSCGPLDTECDCFTYLEASEPGCWVVAVPDTTKQVMVKAGGCVDATEPWKQQGYDNSRCRPTGDTGVRVNSRQECQERAVAAGKSWFSYGERRSGANRCYYTDGCELMTNTKYSWNAYGVSAKPAPTPAELGAYVMELEVKVATLEDQVARMSVDKQFPPTAFGVSDPDKVAFTIANNVGAHVTGYTNGGATVGMGDGEAPIYVGINGFAFSMVLKEAGSVTLGGNVITWEASTVCSTVAERVAAGVQIQMCPNTASVFGFTEEDLCDGITLADAGMTITLARKQAEGYSYIRA